MTPFKPNVTKSIDNLNQAEKNIEKLKVLFDEVYIDAPEKIDQMLIDNVETKSGSSLTINNTVENGKFDWEFKGNCEQDTTAYIDVGEWEQGGIDGTTGLNDNNPSTVRTTGYIAVKPNVLYNISRSIYNSFMAFRFYDSSYNYLGSHSTDGMVTTDQTDNRMKARCIIYDNDN